MKKIIFLATLFLLNGCSTDKSKKIEKKGLNFSTNDASEMFFKNIRQSNYLLEEKVGTDMKVFRHKDYEEMEIPEGLMRVAIVHNWKEDLAYALIELPDQHNFDMTDSILVISTAAVKQDTFHYTYSNVQEQLYFLTDIYNSILDDNHLDYLIDRKKIPWSSKEKEIFRETCADFYRLVNAYSP